MIPEDFKDIAEFDEAFKIANQYNWTKDEMEELNAIKIAKNLLDILDIRTIALKTGLDIKEIKRLKINDV